MRCMFLFLALSVLAVPPASAQDIGAQLRVTATGEATAPPDIAHLRAGAVAAEPTAAAALDATSVAMADILAMLDAAGIAEPDIRTTELRLSPRYDRSGGSLQGETRIAGYEARNIVEVTVRDLDALGPQMGDVGGCRRLARGGDAQLCPDILRRCGRHGQNRQGQEQEHAAHRK
ncbi:MAG: SIMPL domain-containing protein, partial [Rhodobacteraceae bacterium]|nr:SIMPL domain-containing protein [Paracoccaceae bacterium]